MGKIPSKWYKSGMETLLLHYFGPKTAKNLLQLFPPNCIKKLNFVTRKLPFSHSAKAKTLHC